MGQDAPQLYEESFQAHEMKRDEAALSFVSKAEAFLKNSVVKIDLILTPKNLLLALLFSISLPALLALLVTFALFVVGHYDQTSFCIEKECRKMAIDINWIQIDVLRAGAYVATFLGLLAAPYIALRSYIATTQAQLFGNNISHLGFFERFVNHEISKRTRISKSSLDMFSLYRVMYPSGSSEIYASHDFYVRMTKVSSVIESSNHDFSNTESKFLFSKHQASLVSAMKQVFLHVDRSSRIDFLECEDEILELLSVLSRVFCKEGEQVVFPARKYR